jgi:hypothetical protein
MRHQTRVLVGASEDLKAERHALVSRIVANEFATSSGVSKSAKAMLQ